MLDYVCGWPTEKGPCLNQCRMDGFKGIRAEACEIHMEALASKKKLASAERRKRKNQVIAKRNMVKNIHM